MDASAKDDCETIAGILEAEGIKPFITDDSAPGVPEGVFEVRVARDQAAQAEEIVAKNPLPDDVEEVDSSADLNLETIFHAEASAIGEMEAMEIKNILESNGIAAMVVGDSVLPNLGFEVRVTRDLAGQARVILAEAQSSGPDAAEQAVREGEAGAKDLQQ